jgi:hypothetical protein
MLNYQRVPGTEIFHGKVDYRYPLVISQWLAGRSGKKMEV